MINQLVLYECPDQAPENNPDWVPWTSSLDRLRWAEGRRARIALAKGHSDIRFYVHKDDAHLEYGLLSSALKKYAEHELRNAEAVWVFPTYHPSKAHVSDAYLAAAILYANTVAAADNGGWYFAQGELQTVDSVTWYMYLLYVAEELAEQGL